MGQKSEHHDFRHSPVAKTVLSIQRTGVWTVVENPPAMQETQVRSLGQEESLEKEIATHSSIFASSWTEEPIGLLSLGLQRVRHDLPTKQHSSRELDPTCRN